MQLLGRGGQAFLLRETGTATLEELALRLEEAVGKAGAIIDQSLA